MLRIIQLLIILGGRVLGCSQEGGNAFNPCSDLQPGPWVQATNGGVWPRPKTMNSHREFMVLNPHNFEILLTGDAGKCDILINSVQRFKRRAFPGRGQLATDRFTVDAVQSNPDYRGLLDTLEVSLLSTVGCESRPYYGMNEDCMIIERIQMTPMRVRQ